MSKPITVAKLNCISNSELNAQQQELEQTETGDEIIILAYYCELL